MTMPSFIMGFREGLEAFLLIAITLKYITSIDQGHLKNKVIQGTVAGLIISVILGLLLNLFSEYLGGVSTLTKLVRGGFRISLPSKSTLPTQIPSKGTFTPVFFLFR